MLEMSDRPECWPALPLESWKETYATLHMWSQIVGKVRLKLTPQSITGGMLPSIELERAAAWEKEENR